MSMNDIEKKITEMAVKDGLNELLKMSDWMKRFTKDNERRAKRLAKIVKLAEKGFVCKPYAEEAAAVVKRTADDSERILRWLRLLDNIAEKAKEEAAKQPPRS